jgi:hypothetical protein
VLFGASQQLFEPSPLRRALFYEAVDVEAGHGARISRIAG